ncbi:esterase/lipase family protein [Variovorax sp. LT1R20]|uniref:esterase/lipase family protein n=1 Tax=Variovorax sp. LT1R20 TaxID=3443729 RepID=UPI003F45F405
MNVVLVHGIFDDGGIFQRLERCLRDAGYQCWVPALKPADGRRGIHDLACKLKAYIDDRIGPAEPIAIVGFSMGCIVSRHYLQLLDGHARTRALFAISAPHQGTLVAYLYPGKGARDMRPGSPLLEELKRTEDCLARMAVFGYWTSFDATVFPARSSHWPLASSSLNARALLHRFMPANERVCADIVRRMVALDVPRA